ncbi:hypothetical protein KVR01_002467 [Diaporthe batatas]|uniref:uncharacterized protein n=1 Tax=Diaporthe batatas TaxID=748121 RepID=UPI001D03C24F|nr:uncharacterized protein KVR01_002467 [Diaporthe batatas]KAG8166778.1 hypothetical protein KVR01_002467 [Diaporthe batatas]
MKRFPNEIVDHILNDLYCSCLNERRPTCNYATVCRYWQEHFEVKHFSKLTLTWLDFPEFKDYVVGGRRRLVKRIRVKVPFGYTYRGSWAPWADIYVYMITTLFETLDTWWDIFNSKNPGKMTLKISVLGANQMRLADLPQRFIYKPQLSDSRTPPVHAVNRLVFHPGVFDIFRRRRRSLHYLLRSLPALRVLDSENRSKERQIYYGRDLTLPSELYIDLLGSLPVSCALGLGLAGVSRQLRHLAASFVVEASHFFQPFWPQPPNARPTNTSEWVWEKLETLALTSSLLRRPHENAKEVNQLLEATSMAVRRMPRLRTLEMWNGDDDRHACVFRYSYSPASRRASLTLLGTSEIGITEDTERSWDETVRQKTVMDWSEEVRIRFERLEITPPFMAEAVSWFLEQRDRVATPKVGETPFKLLLFHSFTDPKYRR